MSIKLYNILVSSMVMLFIAIGFYHTVISFINYGYIVFDKEVFYIIYNVSYNLIIITLLYTIKKILKHTNNAKDIKIDKFIIATSIYPAVKIVLNLMCLHDFTGDVVKGYINIICMGLIFLIMTTLILIKLISLK